MLKNDKIEKLIAEQPEELDFANRQSIILHRVLHAYKDSKKCKLDELDFRYVVWQNEISETIQILRACGIKTFTISEDFVLRVLPGVLKEGCEIIGCICINDEYANPETGEFDQIPALRLRVSN